MSQFTFKPFSQWNRPRVGVRRDSSFRSEFLDTRNLIESELKSLKAKNAIVEVGAKEFLRSGLPRQNTIWHPGVVLTFESAQGEFVYPADRFHDWRDNLRGIALSLEALRKVDRYGVTQGGEQYQGWKALPAPSIDEDFDCAIDATKWLARESGLFLSIAQPDGDALEKACKVIARRVHPDAAYGDADKFRRLQKAKTILGL